MKIKNKQARYYEDLIENRIAARTALEKVIQMTKKEPAFVLATIGLKHPASSIVFTYLARQEYRKRSEDLPRNYISLKIYEHAFPGSSIDIR